MLYSKLLLRDWHFTNIKTVPARAFCIKTTSLIKRFTGKTSHRSKRCLTNGEPSKGPFFSAGVFGLRKDCGNVGKRAKGQFFSIDFLISITAFLFIVAFLQVQQNRMLDDIREQRGIILQDVLSSTMSVILISPGYPPVWNSSNVLSIGLVDAPHILNAKKIETFVELPEDKATRLLGVRGAKFYFAVQDRSGIEMASERVLKPPIAYMARQLSDTSVLSILNSSNMAWDFYWSGGAAPPNNARNVYLNANEITLMGWFITNRTNYSTLIYEDMHVLDTDLSSVEQDSLRSWVNSSGTYIQIQHNEAFLNIFGISALGPSDNLGTVNREDIIINLTNGQNVDFETGTNTFDIPSSPYPLKDIINSTSTPARCIVCKWTYVNGTIYYLPDGSLQAGNLALSSKGMNGVNYTSGVYPFSNASSNITSTRSAILNGQQVFVKMLLWS